MTLERTKSEMQKALVDAQSERSNEAQRAFDAERELRALRVGDTLQVCMLYEAANRACIPQMKCETSEIRLKELERQCKATKERLQETRDQLNEVTNERTDLERQLSEVRERIGWCLK